MASDMFGSPLPAPGDDTPEEAGLPEPPAPEGPGLFGDPAPPPAPAAAPVAKPAEQPGYRVLARKYRPTSFDDLIGQDVLVRTLRHAFAQGRVHHAFLLTGVRGVGKTTTARIIARALNCIGVDGKGGPTADPCGVCPECKAILADRHPDVVELDAASNNSVDDVRELREALRFRASQGRQKVFILDECHMLSGAAFNAFLKTLEEPPSGVTFVLATTELRKVPITIRSRCQTEADALAMIARAADGSVRDGLSLLDQAIGQSGAAHVAAEAVRDMLGLADRAMIIDLMEALMGGDIAAALGIMDRAHELGADPLVILQDLAELCHLLTRFRAAPALRQDGSLPEAERVRGAALAQRLSVPVLGRTWQMLLKGIGELQLEGADRRAAAEMVLIRIAHVADMPTPGDLVKRLTEAGEPVRAEAAPSQPVTALAQPSTWQEIVALASGVKPLLHAQLRHSVHPVRIAPGRLEINPEPDAPRDLAAQLTALLTEATGQRWTVIITQEAGAPTLAAQGKEAEADRLAAARAHPLVQAILAAFPGATIEAVHDGAADAYGLSRSAATTDDDARDFAPPDAEPAYGDDETPPDDF